MKKKKQFAISTDTVTGTMSVAAYRKTKTEEHSLQVTVLRHISLRLANPDIFYFGIPNAAKRSFRLAARMKREGLTAGIADICIMMPYGTYWLELKTDRKGSKQSADQVYFQQVCERLNHPYAIARNIDQALDILRHWRVIK